MSEPAVTPFGLVQFVDLDEANLLDRLDHELCDPLPSLDHESLGGVGVDQQHLQLAAIVGIDQSRGVQAGHSVLEGKPAARLHEPGITAGYRNRDTGRDQGTTAAGRKSSRLRRS